MEAEETALKLKKNWQDHCRTWLMLRELTQCQVSDNAALSRRPIVVGLSSVGHKLTDLHCGGFTLWQIQIVVELHCTRLVVHIVVGSHCGQTVTIVQLIPWKRVSPFLTLICQVRITNSGRQRFGKRKIVAVKL